LALIYYYNYYTSMLHYICYV